MHIEYHKWWSPRLNEDLEIKVYGHQGRPLLIFPSSRGKFYEFADMGMIKALEPFINEGRLRVFCPDGRDWETWFANAHPADKARRANDYEATIIHEVVPFIKNCQNAWDIRIMTGGCSFGAYHAANFILKHPDVFDVAFCLSGCYTIKQWTGGFGNQDTYYNDPLAYLDNMHDSWFLDRLRKSLVIVCVGQGPWEGEFIGEAQKLVDKLRAKEIPVWHEVWGHDAAHDWPWWRKQFPYLMGKIL